MASCPPSQGIDHDTDVRVRKCRGLAFRRRFHGRKSHVGRTLAERAKRGRRLWIGPRRRTYERMSSLTCSGRGVRSPSSTIDMQRTDVCAGDRRRSLSRASAGGRAVAFSAMRPSASWREREPAHAQGVGRRSTFGWRQRRTRLLAAQDCMTANEAPATTIKRDLTLVSVTVELRQRVLLIQLRGKALNAALALIAHCGTQLGAPQDRSRAWKIAVAHSGGSRLGRCARQANRKTIRNSYPPKTYSTSSKASAAST